MLDRIFVGVVIFLFSAVGVQAGQIATDASGTIPVASATGDALLAFDDNPDSYPYYAYNLNDDNEPNDSLTWNGWFYQIRYKSVGPVDLVINVEPTGGTTEFDMAAVVNNQTNQTWIGFRLEIGFGTGQFFEISREPDNLDFDTPDCDLAPNTGFSQWLAPITVPWADDDTVTLMTNGTGDTLSTGWETTIYYVLDIPDGITQFALRHTPIIAPSPEPTSLGILSVMTIAILRRRRHS